MGHLVLAGDELLWRQMVITIVPPLPAPHRGLSVLDH
jgi:hypothetical protein